MTVLRSCDATPHGGQFGATKTRMTRPLRSASSPNLAPELSTRFAAGNGLFISGAVVAPSASATVDVDLFARINNAAAKITNPHNTASPAHLMVRFVSCGIVALLLSRQLRVRKSPLRRH